MSAILRLLAALLLGQWAWGAAVFSEVWLGGVAEEGRLAAWGAHHAWWAEEGATHGAEEGLPEGVRALLPAPGACWALTGEGVLRRLGEPPAWWSAGAWSEAAPAGGGRAWLLDGQSLTLAALAAEGSPEALAHLHLAGACELQIADGEAWLRQGTSLWRATAQGLRPGGRLPRGWRAWAPWQEGALWLDGEGRLLRVRTPQDSTAAWPLPELRASRLRRVPGALWLRDSHGAWLRWREGAAMPERVERAREREGEWEWLPVSARVLLRQDADSRQWWSDADGSWKRLRALPRAAQLRDRLVRWAGVWSLGRDGALTLERPGERLSLGRWPGALSLHRAGAGPLLLTPLGLSAFSEGGAPIGGWSGAGGLAAQSVEDGLLLAGEELLRSFWTDEEDPWLRSELPLPEASRLSASPAWAAVLAEGELHLLDRGEPWTPRLLGSRPAPVGLADFLLAEDRLLLAGEDRGQAWSCREGEWQPLPLEVDLRASWLCLRGPGRLLALDRRGLLRQLRLEDNLPVAEEWRALLPLAGRMELARDSLRVLGEAGWLDWPLPALLSPRHEVRQARRADPARRELRFIQAGGGLRLSWDGSPGPATLRLHDLLGRRLRETRGAPPLWLGLEGLPAGLYVVEGDWQDGARRARVLRWQP